MLTSSGKTNKSAATTQTDAPRPEQWQTLKFIWRNKVTLLTCLCVVTALVWQVSFFL
jgi:hypothetical protein